MEASYRARSPGPDTPARDRLIYHAGRMLEFAWNANAYSKVKARALNPRSKVAALARTDVFCCMHVCARLLDETLGELGSPAIPSAFRECWTQFSKLLQAAAQRHEAIQDKVARQIFCLLFVGAAVMRACLEADGDKPLLDESEVFAARVYPLEEAERGLLASLPSQPFQGKQTFDQQLRALSEDFDFLRRTI